MIGNKVHVVSSGILIHEVDGGRQYLIAQCQYCDTGFQTAGASKQVASHRFGGTDGNLALAKKVPDGMCLQRVANRSGSAMSVYIIDLVRANASVAHRVAHYAESAFVLGRGLSHMVGVSGHAVAGNFGKDGCAAFLGVLELFQNQDAGALAHHKTVAVLVPGTAGFLRLVVAGGKCAHGGKSADAHGSDGGLGAASDHHVSVV